MLSRLLDQAVEPRQAAAAAQAAAQPGRARIDRAAAQARRNPSPWLFHGDVPGQPLKSLFQGLGARPAPRRDRGSAIRFAAFIRVRGSRGRPVLLIIGKLLGHTKAATTQKYAHLADDALREATTRIGGEIASAGGPAKNVVSIDGGLP